MHFENKSHIEAFRHHSQIFISTVYCSFHTAFQYFGRSQPCSAITRQSNLTFFLRHEHSQRRTKSALSVGARAFVFHTQTVAAISGAACLSRHKCIPHCACNEMFETGTKASVGRDTLASVQNTICYTK